MKFQKDGKNQMSVPKCSKPPFFPTFLFQTTTSEFGDLFGPVKSPQLKAPITGPLSSPPSRRIPVLPLIQGQLSPVVIPYQVLRGKLALPAVGLRHFFWAVTRAGQLKDII